MSLNVPIPNEYFHSLFKILTRDKAETGIAFADFKSALVRIAVKGRTYFDIVANNATKNTKIVEIMSMVLEEKKKNPNFEINEYD